MKLDVNLLQNELEIFHLLIYRNRNQHGSSKWWMYLSIIHRRGRQILLHIEDNRRVEQIATFLVKKIIPNGYRAFHNILNLGQFVSLGIALLAGLSRMYSLLLPVVEIRDIDKIKAQFLKGKEHNMPLDDNLSHIIGHAISRQEVNQLIMTDSTQNRPPSDIVSDSLSEPNKLSFSRSSTQNPEKKPGKLKKSKSKKSKKFKDTIDAIFDI